MSPLLRGMIARQQATPYRVSQLCGTREQLRNASLSAIHRGIRRSDRPNNVRERRADTKSQVTEPRGRSRDRDDHGSKPDAFSNKFRGAIGGREHHFKPKKALQKMQEQEEEGGRKSRSKRFNDPEYSFGKKSLVYQLNRGELKDKVSKLLGEDGSGQDSTSSRPGSAWRQNFGRDALRSETKGQKDGSGSAWRQNFGRDALRSETKRQKDGSGSAWRETSGRDTMRFGGEGRRDGPGRVWRDNFGRDAVRSERREDRRDAPRPRRDFSDRTRLMREGARREIEDGMTPQKRNPRRSDADSSTNRSTEFPVKVQYTTAASQFLFGRSVVKAALRNSRRKLYNLYVYQGSNKKETRDDDWIVAMAEKKNVKVNRVYEADQRMLDKMSKGRPHNGFVLEASPLPQLPLENIGEFSTEKGGYTLTVARQSKEDVEINGTEGYIPCKPDQPRPLVLLLNEILDPGNLGAILRTARFLGASAVAITERTSSTITSTVLKAAAGAAEELRLFTVEDPATFLDASGKAGWKSFAAVAPSPGSRSNRQWTLDTIEDFKPLQKDPCILVLGNEGTGLPDYIRRKSTHEVTIPRMTDASSSVDSLNVSVAAALLCNSFFRGVRQKDLLTLTEKLQVDARKADGGEALF